MSTKDSKTAKKADSKISASKASAEEAQDWKTLEELVSTLEVEVSAIGNSEGEVKEVAVKEAADQWLSLTTKGRQAEVAKALEGRSSEYASQVLGIVAVYETTKFSWAHCAQAVGLGNTQKPKSGASSARKRYLVALGKADEPESVATEAARSNREKLAEKLDADADA